MPVVSKPAVSVLLVVVCEGAAGGAWDIIREKDLINLKIINIFIFFPPPHLHLSWSMKGLGGNVGVYLRSKVRNQCTRLTMLIVRPRNRAEDSQLGRPH